MDAYKIICQFFSKELGKCGLIASRAAGHDRFRYLISNATRNTKGIRAEWRPCMGHSTREVYLFRPFTKTSTGKAFG